VAVEMVEVGSRWMSAAPANPTPATAIASRARGSATASAKHAMAVTAIAHPTGPAHVIPGTASRLTVRVMAS
jgi:hypothetical protein